MKIKVGISSCLLGHEVRFDGGHKHSRLCTESLSRYFDFVAECPEVGAGMTIPRRPIRLIGDVTAPKSVYVHDNSVDFTDKIIDFGKQKAKEHHDLCGYIFMKNSPSCGVFRVKVYQENGYPAAEPGQGLYSKQIMAANPLLPVEESGRLADSFLRENFITRVFAYHNWQQLQQAGLSYQGIIDFHSRYKYVLMAHSPARYAELGRMLADAGNHDIENLAQRYFEALMTELKRLASRKTHTNVLMHLQGYLKKVLSPAEKQELANIIEQYRTAQVPLIVPMTLIKHHFNNHPDPYIAKQAYLQPYPEDLSLRNAI
ncbi:MAG: 2-thiouracil desulfurase family protein [Gammaproteobacteria bacterium]|nr:2-thiouracil desulfurase family protein [Gammaproteobacteria bacterium]